MNDITIGIPRGILYYKYKHLWMSFFKELKINILVSPVFEEFKYSDNQYLDNYFSSVKYLSDKVDYVFIERIDNEDMCYYFNSLYDIINTTFDIKIVVLNIDNKSSEEQAFIKLGEQLGFSKNYSLNAYKTAKLEEYKQNKINYLLDQKKIKKASLKALIIGEEYIYNNQKLIDLIRDKLKYHNISLINASDINPDSYNDIKSYINEYINNIKNIIDKVDLIIHIKAYPSIYKKDIIFDNKVLSIVINKDTNIDNIKLEIDNFINKMENVYE